MCWFATEKQQTIPELHPLWHRDGICAWADEEADIELLASTQRSQEVSDAALSAFISSQAKPAEQTGTYGGEVDGEVAGRYFEQLLREFTWEKQTGNKWEAK